jgi:hypothetical protein
LSGGLGGSYNCGSGDYGSGGGGGFKRDVEDYNSGPREELGMIPMAVKSPGKEIRSSSAFGMQEEAVSQSNPVDKPATGEGMDKSTLVHTQIQIIIIHFLPSPFPPIPNG